MSTKFLNFIKSEKKMQKCIYSITKRYKIAKNIKINEENALIGHVQLQMIQNE